MKIGVISDIHGYFAALQQAVKFLDKQNVDEIICLGDVIDGGEQNNECVSFLQKHSIKTVRGNHDETHDCVINNQNQAWLDALPEQLVIDDWLFTHASPRPKVESIHDSIRAWNAFDECDFKYACVGHAHIQAVFRYKDNMIADSEECSISHEQVVRLKEGYRYLVINPSLAYQRRGINQPGFCIIHNNKKQISFHRLNLPPIIAY